MSLAPFVASPPNVVEKMLELAELKQGETLFDLGCGDARIVILAAQKFGAKAVGVELDEGRYKDCINRIKQAKLEDKVKIVHGNALDISLKDADVVTLYLLTSANERLKPNLERDLSPGARVVSHDFSMPGWKTIRTEEIRETWGSHTIYVYKR
ncbi:class I SAM-dependent methyltransferase [Candidatus Bathyarchaeota archaeon]|nr:class I SAM-dependent methyltransferase [Candidatus Bathyarchaeota archaeon]